MPRAITIGSLSSTTFLFSQPFSLLSGFAFPVRNMPEPIQYLTLLNPVRCFMEIVRGLFLKGSGSQCCGRNCWPRPVSVSSLSPSARCASASA
jgi:ABC-2 type transport system permease protein